MNKTFLNENRNVLIAGVLCAILSYVGVEMLHSLPSEILFADAAGTYLPGFLFGALVLAPRVTAAHHRLARQGACVVIGTLLYYLAIQTGVLVAVTLHVPSSLAGTVAALLGALVTCLVARWLIPMTIARETWRKAAIFGALGGAVFGISTGANASKLIEALPIVVGLIIWQAGVAVSLFGYSRSSK